MYTQDLNQLRISGHVNEPPLLDEDSDVVSVCRFVLTHSTHVYCRRGWEQQHYNAIAFDDVAETFARDHQHGQVIIVTGELDVQIQQTLIGPLPAVSIVAHHIVYVDGPLDRGAHAATTDPQHVLQHTAIGPVPRIEASR